MSNTQQPEALNLEEFRAKVTRAAREPLLARIAELEAQLSAIGAGGVEPLRKAAATPIAWYVTGCSTMLDEHDAKAEAKRCGGSAKAVPLYTVPRGHAATHPTQQGMSAPNEWEDIRTLPTCDDLIWLYCQDSNTIDGPIAPEPNLEEYGWSHWAYANAPSTVWIDAAKSKKEGYKK